MNKDWFKKKRLSEQLKFFGAKKTKFISCYAKKPRVRVSVKCDRAAILRSRGELLYGGAIRQAELAAMQHQALAAECSRQNQLAAQRYMQNNTPFLGGLGLSNFIRASR